MFEQTFLLTHLGVNELAYPPSGSESSAGAALSSTTMDPEACEPIVRCVCPLVASRLRRP